MNIVGHSFFLRNLRKLDFFKLNLGKTKKLLGSNEKTDNFRKLSEFEIKYENLYNRGLMLFGNIGKATFYEDVTMEIYSFLVFVNDDIYKITWTENDIIDMKNYILETLRKIDEIYKKEEQKTISDKLKDDFMSKNEYWEAKDDKNKGKKYTVNQELSREEYRKKLLEIKR